MYFQDKITIRVNVLDIVFIATSQIQWYSINKEQPLLMEKRNINPIYETFSQSLFIEFYCHQL